MIAREAHLDLPAVDVDLGGTLRRFVEMDGGQRNRNDHQQDQERKVDDRQDVREGDAVFAHGFEVSGRCGDLQWKSAGRV